MFPLRDNIRARSFPAVNITLIVINCAFFVVELIAGRDLNELINRLGVIPARFTGGADVNPEYMVVPAVLTLFTSMFLHGGWFHLIGNMVFLYVFGDNVEDRMGKLKYLIFYLLCGVVAGISQVLVSPGSIIPSIGASGAIGGVLGAYFTLYPRARVATLVFFGFFIRLIELPAIAFLGFWFIMQFFSGAYALALGAAGRGGVAWWAHIGGFVAGLLFVHLFKGRRRPYYYKGW
jgi:membrane associated rhomboid family serine protease